MDQFAALIAPRTPLEVILFVITCLMFACWIMGNRVNYRLGVNDGYGFAREPWNPGYRRAGYILKEYAAHKWPEVLRANDTPNPDDSSTWPKTKDWVDKE